jgi:membrane protein implicated in regulation of membrane protease activity
MLPPRMAELGKTLVLLGILVAAIGLVLWSGIGRGWIGRLPGDIHVRRGNFQFYFPVVTCLIVSVVLTLLSWFFRGRR